jgi:hypothetical protein
VAILGLESAGPADVEARVLPGAHCSRGLGQDLAAAEHHLEEALGEDFLKALEVDVLHGEEGAVVGEKPQGAKCVGVRMRDQQVSEGLGHDEHGGQRALELGEAARRLSPEEIAC